MKVREFLVNIYLIGQTIKNLEMLELMKFIKISEYFNNYKKYFYSIKYIEPTSKKINFAT